MFKKILFLFLILFLFFGNINTLKAQITRTIGPGLTSSCTIKSEADNSYDCECQASGTNIPNYVNDCHVGKIISHPVCACCGDCQLVDFIGIGIGLANIILKYTGVFALLMFVIGGLMMMTSAGISDRIQKGKKIVTGALIGLMIIIFSSLIIRTIQSSLGTDVQLLDGPSTESQTEEDEEEEDDDQGGLPDDWALCPNPSNIPDNQQWCYNNNQCAWAGSTPANKKGCQLDDVNELKTVLNSIGCECGVANNFYDQQAHDCVLRFQQAQGWTGDGLVGSITWSRCCGDTTSQRNDCSN